VLVLCVSPTCGNVYGIQGNVKNWISSFLNCRTQYVVLEGEFSPRCPVLSGVPQGTVHPTLFSIYINALPDSISCMMIAYCAKPYEHLMIQINYRKIWVPYRIGNKSG